MLTAEQARLLARAWLEIVMGGRAAILDEQTRTLSFGWVFFYQSTAYLSTGSVGDLLAGNAPFIVDKYTSEIRVLGTARPLEAYLEEYETARRPSRAGNS